MGRVSFGDQKMRVRIVSSLSTLTSSLLGTSSDQISQDVAAAERAAAVAYVIIAIELAILILLGITISRKLSK